MRNENTAGSPTETVRVYARTVPLVDDHVHSIYRKTPGPREYAECLFLTGDEIMLPELEGTVPGRLLAREVMPRFEEWSGVRTGGTDLAGYLRRQREQSPDDRREWTETLLRGTGTKTWILDDGCARDSLLPADLFSAVTGGRVYRSVRLETVGEDALNAIGGNPEAFAATFRGLLLKASESESTVAFKSIAAYRTGFRIDWSPPDDEDLIQAVRTALGKPEPRIDDPRIESFIVSEALKAGLPIQFHVGFGDSDARLSDGDPTLLKPLIDRAAGLHVPIVLLHCAPFERQAAWLCSLHRNVYMDLSLTTLHAGPRIRDVIERTLEWCPPARLLYGSDGIGVPETHALEAATWRTAVGDVYAKRVEEGFLDVREACREIGMLSYANSERLYLPEKHSSSDRR